jgi:hypothetical protein
VVRQPLSLEDRSSTRLTAHTNLHRPAEGAAYSRALEVPPPRSRPDRAGAGSCGGDFTVGVTSAITGVSPSIYNTRPCLGESALLCFFDAILVGAF